MVITHVLTIPKHKCLGELSFRYFGGGPKGIRPCMVQLCVLKPIGDIGEDIGGVRIKGAQVLFFIVSFKVTYRAIMMCGGWDVGWPIWNAMSNKVEWVK